MAYATAADLAAFLQVPSVDTYTANLCLEFAAGLMQAEGAPVLISPVPDDLRGVNVALAVQGFTNPKALRTRQEAQGSANSLEVYAGVASEVGMTMTASQRAVCRRYRPRITSIGLTVAL